MTIKRITIMMMMIVITTEGFRPLNLVSCSKLYLPKMLFSSSGKEFNVKIIPKIRESLELHQRCEQTGESIRIRSKRYQNFFGINLV